MQSDFSLLSPGKIQVHVYNAHQLLLKSFQRRGVAGIALMTYSSPHPSVSVVCVGGPCKLVNAASVWILRNVTRRHVWAIGCPEKNKY